MRDPLYAVSMTIAKTLTFKIDVDIFKNEVEGETKYEWINSVTGEDSMYLFDTVLEAEQDAVRHFGSDYE